jgi:hypothetical protein
MPKQSLEVAGLSAAPGQRAASLLNLTLDGTPIKMPLY